jgi:hypothetical protein
MTHDSNKKTNKREPSWVIIIVVAIAFVIIGFVFLACFQFAYVEENWTHNGDKDYTRFGISGDFFGFANAVFSALAFAILIVTMWMQSYELSQQREELRITQDVFRQQTNEMEEQNKSLKLQAIESTFFKMLQLHGEIVSGMVTTHVHNLVTGRSVFEFQIQALKEHSRAQRFGTNFKITDASYDDWYEKNEAAMGHYFRTLYNTMRFIDENGGEYRHTYARLLRAQLSSKELELLLYNGVSRWGKEKFKPLMEQYSMLKHLRRDPEFDSWRSRYDAKAFDSSASRT